MLQSIPHPHSSHSATGCCSWRCIPCSCAASHTTPPTRQHAPGSGGLPATHPHSTRRFTTRITRHIARSPAHGDISKMISDEIRQPASRPGPSFCRPRVLAVGYGALRPSGRFESGVVSYSTRLTAPDTLVASVAANGSYWSCAVHFSASHGAALRNTLCAQLRLRIRMVVLPLLTSLLVFLTQTARSACCVFQRRVVVRMTNLPDRISKRYAATCYTDLPSWSHLHSATCQPPRHPFGLRLLFFGFCQNFTVRFLSHDNVLLHVSAQHRRP